MLETFQEGGPCVSLECLLSSSHRVTFPRILTRSNMQCDGGFGQFLSDEPDFGLK